MISSGFTGTRQGMTAKQKSARRKSSRRRASEFYHGDCIGADSKTHDIVDECGYGIILPPPTNYSERAWQEVPRHMGRPEKPYLDRNKDIVRENASLIAAPAEPEEQLRSGTWSTVRFAHRRGKPVFLLPDGTVRR